MMDREDSESSGQDTSSDGMSSSDDSTDTESVLDDSVHDQFEPSARPASTLLPSYLVPARVPPYMPPSLRRCDRVFGTRQKSTPTRRSPRQSQATELVAPTRPEIASTRTSQQLATPRLSGIPHSSQSAQHHRPATAATNRLPRPSRSLLKPTAGTSRPAQPPPAQLPTPGRPSDSVPTPSLDAQSRKLHNPARASSQPQKPSQPWNLVLAPHQTDHSIQCPQCMLYNPPTATCCRACSTSSFPLPAPRSHATSIAPIDTRPDVLYGMVLVHYTSNHINQQFPEKIDQDSEFLCTGAAGPAGTIDDKTGEPVPISGAEWARLLKEKKRKEREDLKRPERWERSRRMRGGGGGGRECEMRPYFTE